MNDSRRRCIPANDRSIRSIRDRVPNRNHGPRPEQKEVDTETKEKSHGNPAVRRSTETSYEIRFIPNGHQAKLWETKDSPLVGAPGLEPGTR